MSSAKTSPPVPSPVSPEDFLTSKDVCKLLHVSDETLSRMRSRKGSIPFLRVSPCKILYRRSDVESWITERTVRLA